MLVSTYDLSGNPTGGVAYLSLVRPYAETLQGQNSRTGLGAAEMLYRLSATSLGWTGSMAPGFVVLDNLSGPNLVNAVNQTLPVLTGAASQATYTTQRVFQQAMTGRLDDVLGVNGAVAAERNVWMKPLGGSVRQGGLDGVAGYNASGGGIAVGADTAISARTMIGGVFAYSHHTITGSEDAVPNRLGIDSYQAGIYGAHALGDGFQIDGQLDGALNDNVESRSLAFINSTAGAAIAPTADMQVPASAN
ncbi:autotransporter outer membrane beta-barrel domain-containing protein [Bradyrhizobium guangdongense]